MSDDLREFLAKAKGSAAGARVARLDDLGVALPSNAPWGIDAMRGRLIELSARGATATLTTSIELVLEAQHAGEPVAWVTLVSGTFYPPDVADSGVDLAALVVVRTFDLLAAARAAERLLRSGAFGLVVLDFGGLGEAPNGTNLANLTSSWGRLVTLAQAHDAAVVCITEKPNEAASLGSLVSMRAEALRVRDRSPGGASGGFDVTLRVLKDKRRGPGWSRTVKLRGPAGF